MMGNDETKLTFAETQFHFCGCSTTVLYRVLKPFS
jgi:hypothetical protein